MASGLSKNSRAEAFAVEGGQGRPATGAERRGSEGRRGGRGQAKRIFSSIRAGVLELELVLGAGEIGLSLERRGVERRGEGGEVRSLGASALISEVPSAALVLPSHFGLAHGPMEQLDNTIHSSTLPPCAVQ